MKKQTKSKKSTVKELASQFDQDLNSTLTLKVLPDGSVVYKDYIVKSVPNSNWGVFHIHTKELVEQFFLKSCALMAAKAYMHTSMEKYFEIKRLDNRYWASYCDTLVYKKNIKTAKDFERYLILLNKLEHSDALSMHFKEEISRMFRWSFV